MWEAEVIERVSPGWVTVVIPGLFRDSPVGPMRSALDVGVGETVVVADLAPASKARQWWVLGPVSEVGRWGEAYPHTHPISQVDGLTDALAGKADDTDLTGYSPVGHTHDASAVGSGVLDPARLPAATSTTQGAISANNHSRIGNATALATASRVVMRDAAGRAAFADPSATADAATKGYVDTGLSGKADNAGAWQKITLASGWIDRSGGASVSPGAGMSAGLYVRSAPAGIHVRGVVVPSSYTGYPLTIATLPIGWRPGWSVTIPCLGENSGATSYMNVPLEISYTGAVSLSKWSNSTTLQGLQINTVIPTA